MHWKRGCTTMQAIIANVVSPALIVIVLLLLLYSFHFMRSISIIRPFASSFNSFIRQAARLQIRNQRLEALLTNGRSLHDSNEWTND